MKKLKIIILVIFGLQFLTVNLFSAEMSFWDRNRLNGCIGGVESSELNPGWYYENWFLGTFKFQKKHKFKLTVDNELLFSFKYKKLSKNRLMFGPGYELSKALSIDIYAYYTFRKQISPKGFPLSNEAGIIPQLTLKANLGKKFYLYNRIRFVINIYDEKYFRLQNLIILKYKFGIFHAFIGDEIYYHLHGEEPVNLNFAFFGVGISPLALLTIDVSAGIKFFNYKNYLFIRFDVILKF